MFALSNALSNTMNSTFSCYEVHCIKQGQYKNKRQLGFTLIEMLLSLAIFAMIGMATYSVLNTTISSKDSIENQADQLKDMQRAMLILENDFQQITQRKIRLNGESPLDNFFIAEPYLLDSEELGFAFVRDGWTNPVMILPRSEMQAVGYRLKEGNLERLYFNYVDADSATEPRIQILIRGVTELSLSYYYEKEWQEELPDSGLPLLIKLIVVTETYKEIERVFSLVSLTEKINVSGQGANPGTAPNSIPNQNPTSSPLTPGQPKRPGT